MKLDKTKKCKLEVYDSLNDPLFFMMGDLLCLNLNRFVSRRSIYNLQLTSKNSKLISEHKEINLCNLSSLLYRLNIPYDDIRTYEFINRVKLFLRAINPAIRFVQNNVESNFEVDCQPLANAIFYDDSSRVLFINKTLKNSWDLLGYTGAQLSELLISTKDLRQVLPVDLYTRIPLLNNKNKVVYKLIKGLLNDKWVCDFC